MQGNGKFWSVKLELKYLETPKNIGPAVYVANHQNNYDLFTLPAKTENCGPEVKKASNGSFFGQLCRYQEVCLIDRANRSKAASAISKSAEEENKNKKNIGFGCS